MTQPLLTRSQPEIYSQALSSLWSYYFSIDDPSFALKNDIDAWEVCLRHPAFYQGTQQRLNEVAGPEWHFVTQNGSRESVDLKAADVMEDAFGGIRSFAVARKRLAQAVFLGMTTEYVHGARKWCKLGGVWANWWVPTWLEHVDHRRWKIVPSKTLAEDGTPRVRGDWYISVVPSEASERDHLHGSVGLHGYRKVKHPEHYIRVVYDDEESRLGFGRGIMDPSYFWVWTSTIVHKEGLQGLERWAQGIPVLEIDIEAHRTTGRTVTQEMDDAEARLLKHRGRGAFIIDKRDKLTVVTGGGEGHGIVKEWRDYCDSKIIGITTGAILASGTGSDVGSFARDKAGLDVQSVVVQFDREKLAEDISETLGKLFWSLNKPQLAEAGLAQASRPKYKIIQRKVFSPNEAAARVATLKGAGIDLPADEVYEQTGFSQPLPGQAVIKGSEPVTGGFGLPAPAASAGATLEEKKGVPEKPRVLMPAEHPALPVGPAEPTDAELAPLHHVKDDAGTRAEVARVHEGLETALAELKSQLVSSARGYVERADHAWSTIRRDVPVEEALAVERGFHDVLSEGLGLLDQAKLLGLMSSVRAAFAKAPVFVQSEVR